MLWFWLDVQPARYLVLVCAVGALVLGGWLTGHWMSQPLEIDDMHPGYFLPTVAGGLIAATALQSVGYHDLALMAFGIGLICWIVLGSVLLQRLFFRPMLAPGLVPLLAIELAPPAVAGNAWVALNPETDAVQYGLGAYTLLMVLVQVRLIPEYRKVPFSPSFWAFTFSYAAAATYAMHWLHLSPFPGGPLTAWVLAILVTGLVLAIGARTVVSMRAGTYLPQATRDPVAP
jgi:tellurite resistance protein